MREREQYGQHSGEVVVEAGVLCVCEREQYGQHSGEVEVEAGVVCVRERERAVWPTQW